MLATTATASFAQEVGLDKTIDGFFDTAFGWFVALIFYSVPLGGTQFPLIAGWLLVGALVFTVYFGFPQFRRFKLSVDIVRGRYSDPHGKEPGEVLLGL